MWLIQLWQPLKFFLIPGPIKSHRTIARAWEIFKVGTDRRTSGAPASHLPVDARAPGGIVADEAITSKVAPEAWGEAMAAMLAELKRAAAAPGMAAAVERVGKVLAEHLPREADDVNELPDRLIEL